MRNHEWELVGNVVIDEGTVKEEEAVHEEEDGFRINLSDLEKETLWVGIEVPEKRFTGTCLTVVSKSDIQIRFSGFHEGERSSILMTTVLNEIGQGIGIIDGNDRAKVTIIA